MKEKTAAGHKTVAKFIDATMKERKVSDNVAAERMGYNSPTIIRMFRHGRAKVSFDEVPDLADAIGADRAMLLEHALREYLPTMVEVLLRCHSGLTDNELAIVDLIRELSGGSDPGLDDGRLRSALEEILGAKAAKSGPSVGAS
jgi:hypothetical protein